MNGLMRDPRNSFIPQFSSDSYRSPTTKRPQQDDQRDDFKREKGLASACVADFIE
jgi:hypothetical protein